MVRLGIPYLGGSLGGFLPSDLASAALWLRRGKDIMSDVDGVYQWSDASASENHAVQSTGSKKPDTADLGGDTVIQGDGTDDELGLTTLLTVPGSFSAWIAVQFPTMAETLFLTGQSANDLWAVLATGQCYTRLSSASSTLLSATGEFTTDTRYVIALHRDGSDNLTLFKNGSDVTLGSPSNSGDFDVDTLLSRSAGAGAGSVSDLYLRELVICDEQVTGDDLTSMNEYMEAWIS